MDRGLTDPAGRVDDLIPLLADPEDPRLPRTAFGAYTAEKFEQDFLVFNDGRPLDASVSERKDTGQAQPPRNERICTSYSKVEPS
uniref:hypothetical protein n=1 Tax=Methylobacterium sp. GC_Met_1 TaxID=2937377 RepID=UPI00226AB9EA